MGAEDEPPSSEDSEPPPPAEEPEDAFGRVNVLDYLDTTHLVALLCVAFGAVCWLALRWKKNCVLLQVGFGQLGAAASLLSALQFPQLHRCRHRRLNLFAFRLSRRVAGIAALLALCRPTRRLCRGLARGRLVRLALPQLLVDVGQRLRLPELSDSQR